MLESTHDTELELPPIPNKRYFTISEVSDLCEVKPHVLRYWEREFSQFLTVQRRGNRRYYQRENIEIMRTIRSLLYDQEYTISGARQRMSILPSEPKQVVQECIDMLLKAQALLAVGD